jgi:hypothetical protein
MTRLTSGLALEFRPAKKKTETTQFFAENTCKTGKGPAVLSGVFLDPRQG